MSTENQIEQRYLTKSQAMQYLGFKSLNGLKGCLAKIKVSIINNRIDKHKLDMVMSGKR